MKSFDNDELDGILRLEEPLTPSSGFAAAVMESVCEAVIAGLDWAAVGEAAAPLQAAAPELGYAAAAVLASVAVVRLPRLRRV
jgi:hypothetical protein